MALHWQVLSLILFTAWIVFSSLFGLTQKIRSLVRPWIIRRVETEVQIILSLQRKQHAFLDCLFSGLSFIVSVPFYTGFLPLLFWSEHGKLARQMTLLMAFCVFIGNSTKDLVSAPRPRSPPIRRVTATKDEEENALEYGLPSSHALNTVCLSGFLVHYMTVNNLHRDGAHLAMAAFFAILLVMVIGYSRVYLGMHSIVDVMAGTCMGVVILIFWVHVHGHVDDFVVHGPNVTTYWAGLSLLLCFAYPTPEFSTPSFDYHTAFNGVAFGIVAGVQQSSSIHRTGEISLLALGGRTMLGLPIILLVKFCSKALAMWTLPGLCTKLSIPARSTHYIPALISPKVSSPQGSINVDTGIRFAQYAGLGWSVVGLAPFLFARLGL